MFVNLLYLDQSFLVGCLGFLTLMMHLHCQKLGFDCGPYRGHIWRIMEDSNDNVAKTIPVQQVSRPCIGVEWTQGKYHDVDELNVRNTCYTTITHRSTRSSPEGKSCAYVMIRTLAMQQDRLDSNLHGPQDLSSCNDPKLAHLPTINLEPVGIGHQGRGLLTIFCSPS